MKELESVKAHTQSQENSGWAGRKKCLTQTSTAEDTLKIKSLPRSVHEINGCNYEYTLFHKKKIDRPYSKTAETYEKKKKKD